jgi:peptidoglycan hydrolase CwlO-like protein
MRFLSFKNKKIIFSIVFFLISAYFMPNHFVFGQEQCSTREECEQLLKQYEEQITKYEADIVKTQGEKNTLQNQISILKKQINKLNLQISQSNLMVKDLTLQVKDTEGSIDQTSLKIIGSRSNLADILQSIREEDQKSLIEILVSEEKLSGFFDNLMNLEVLNSETQKLLDEIKNLKTNLENQKQSLEDETSDLENTIKIQSLQKKESEIITSQKNSLLKLTEAEYQAQLKEKTAVEKKAAEIRAMIFELIGVPEPPNFGDALQIANSVADTVGIRPAFLMAVISQESAIGKNVGQCYVTNSQTGGGIYKGGKLILRIMNPTRDLPIFLDITGDNFSQMPVSCWIPVCYNNGYTCGATLDDKGNVICSRSGYFAYGWGGAMGPAQFIPSTWKLYEDEIKSTFNITSPSPWNIKDSFSAAAIYLADLGAKSKTQQKELSAASRYYGGSSSYARQVITRANCIQDFIDDGTMSSNCEDLIF